MQSRKESFGACIYCACLGVCNIGSLKNARNLAIQLILPHIFLSLIACSKVSLQINNANNRLLLSKMKAFRHPIITQYALRITIENHRLMHCTAPLIHVRPTRTECLRMSMPTVWQKPWCSLPMMIYADCETMFPYYHIAAYSISKGISLPCGSAAKPQGFFIYQDRKGNQLHHITV